MTSFASRWWRQRQARRPVSRWRQVLGLLLLAMMAGGYAGYRYLTDEDRLRYFAEQWLTAFSGGEAHVQRVEFTMFGGLQLVGVTLAIPQQVDFFPAGTLLEDRTLFSAGTLLLRLQPFSIITGHLSVPTIIAVNPRLTLVDRTSDGLDNWKVMLAGRKRARSDRKGGSMRLPELRLRNLEVRQYRLTERGRSGGGVQTFYGGAQPLASNPQIYDLQITKLIPGTDESTWADESGHLQIDMENSAVSGSLPSMSLDELAFAAPPEIKRWLEMLDLAGYVRAEKFEFDPKTGAKARLNLRDAKLSVPIDDSELSNPKSPRYVQFSGVAGSIQLDNRSANIELQGRFRESPVQLHGSLQLPPDTSGGLAAVGLDLDLVATAVPLPRNDAEAAEPERRFVRRWNRLAAFVHDFDGRGNVDMALKLHKEPGTDKGIEFVEGVLTLRGPSAAFEDFPYRLVDMSGEVRFRRDGKIDLVNLTGTHGAGKAIINGKLGGASSHHTIELTIAGQNIAVDGDLLEHMQPDDRSICERFLKSARVNVDVRLSRPAWPWGGQRPRWTSSIDAEFLDGEFLYDGFAYVLDQMRGRLRIAEGVMRMNGLTARHGKATVRVSGTATRAEDKPADLDLQLQAINLALDDDLARAITPEVRPTYQQFAPSGQADVTGRLFSRGGGALQFELDTHLTDGGLNLPAGSGGVRPRLGNIEADLHLTPKQLTVRSLQGRLGNSPLTVEGKLGLIGPGAPVSVRLTSSSLELGPELRAALPVALQSDYDSLGATGRVRLDLTYDDEGQAAASAPASVVAPSARYNAVVEPLDCHMTFSSFPLPLEQVNGRIVLAPEGVRIDKLTGRHGATRLQLAGEIPAAGSAAPLHLDWLTATDLEFTEELRKAVPWRLRRMWNDMQPSGRCDIELTDVRIGPARQGERAWQLAGRVDFKHMGMLAGAEFSEVHGTFEGRAGYDDQFTIDGQLKLQKARVDGRMVGNVTAHILRSEGSASLGIHDIIAGFYGGGLLGEVEINYGVRPPTYGLSLTARDVSLEDFLASTRGPDDKPINAKGRIKGTLSLTGQFSHTATRQGSGNVLIEDAQMLKLPMVLSILQIIHLSPGDNNAFHDALCDFMVDGEDVILDRIDLRGKAVSMVGAGRVHIPDQAMHLVLLIGSPLKLPRVAVLSELVEGVARELMQVHVEGTLDSPTFRGEMVQSLRKAIDAVTLVRTEPPRRAHRSLKEAVRGR